MVAPIQPGLGSFSMRSITCNSDDKFIVRLPAGLRDRIKAAAVENGRTMTAEIVFHLLKALPPPAPAAQWPLGSAMHAVQREEADRLARASMIASMGPPDGKPEPPPVLGAPAPVTIRDLAARLNMDRSACRRYVLSLGYKPSKQRTADSNYQVALTVTAADAREIQKRRADEGYCSPP